MFAIHAAAATVRRLAVLTPVLCLALLGCEASQNPGGAPSLTDADAGVRTRSAGVTIVHPDWRQIGYRWDWTGYPAVLGAERVAVCDPYQDYVVVQGSGNSVTVINALTGRNQWTDRPSNPLARFVGSQREGDTLFTCSQSEVFIIDINTGNWKDRQSLGEVVNTRPVRFGTALVFGTPTGEVFSHRTDFGVTAWRYDIGGPIDADLVYVGPTLAAVSQDGNVAFLDPSSAVALSRPKIGGPLRTNPVTDGSMLFVACTDRSVYAFSAGSDRHVWRYRTNAELTVQPTHDSGVLYVTVPGTGLVALDATRGSENWIGPDAGGQVVARRAGSLIVRDGETIKAVEPANGDVLHSFRVPGITDLVADRFDDGNLYAVTRGNGVIRFSPR